MSLADTLDAMTAEDRAAALTRLAHAWTPPRLRYVPEGFTLSAKQELFLALEQREAFFGGAAGPGKSTALLAAALQYADVPGYSALILRRTYADLSLPGALMDMAGDWLAPTDARWNASRVTWIFPSKATLTFGHLEHEEQKRRYASARFQFIAFDELTQFTETQYTFLFSRLRRPAVTTLGRAPDGTGVAGVPLRMRSASNPGGPGHPWVKRRLVDAKTRYPGAAFVPAKLIENKHLDVVGYAESLQHVTPLDRERLLRGDWDASEEGSVFKATLWMSRRYIDAPPSDVVRQCRHWDFAASEPTPNRPDPDYSVGTLLGERSNGEYVILDVTRFRLGPGDTEAMVQATAAADGQHTPIGVEQEPGSAGKSMVRVWQRALPGYVVHGVLPTGDKRVRAIPVASVMSKEMVWAVRGEWLSAWLDELDGFDGKVQAGMGKHDDQVDSLSGAHFLLSRGGIAKTHVAQGRVPERLVREDDTQRVSSGPPSTVVPDGNGGKPAAGSAVQGMPRHLQRRGARRIATPTDLGGRSGGGL